MIGRVARNENGKAILYADNVTAAMRKAIDETAHRRERQILFNQENGISPVSSKRKLASDKNEEAVLPIHSAAFCENLSILCQQITSKEQELLTFEDNGNEGEVEKIRHQLDNLYRQFIYI